MTQQVMEPIEYNTRWWRGAGRALLLRCPRCGRGKVFRRLMLMNPDCSQCGLQFDRGHGYWLGAMMFNMAFGMGTLIVTLLLLLWITSPNPNWDVVIIGSVAAAGIGPILFFPFSRTLWMAAERSARLGDAAESE